jgi:DNA-binding transcriptional MerR regulator|tara:strand:+ start:341 stop:619 length:279 start_codon:yes stop_codon:yes gene_type:complete
MQALIVKLLINAIIKALNKRFNLNNIKSYVEDDNELDIKMKTALKRGRKNAKYIEELEKDVANLKRDSHPPIFGKKDKNDIIKRLKKLEKER